jgi:hypothetical protein
VVDGSRHCRTTWTHGAYFRQALSDIIGCDGPLFGVGIRPERIFYDNDLGLAVRGEQSHHRQHVLRLDESSSRFRRARIPIGQFAAATDLQRAQHAYVEVSAAHHREGVGVVEIGCARM